MRARARVRVRAEREKSLELQSDCGWKRAAKAKWAFPRDLGWENSFIWLSMSKAQRETDNSG